MTLAFPKSPFRSGDESTKVQSSEKDGILHGFKVLAMDVDKNLKIESWRRWRTRAEIVDALSITEATALTFGIQTAAIPKLSDETTPTEERFIFRMTTLLAAAQKGAIKVLATEPTPRVLCEKDLILFSAFIQFLKADRRTSIPRELIELAWDLYGSDEAKRRNLASLSWTDRARILADELLVEHQKTAVPSQKEFLRLLHERCVNAGLKTSRNGPPSLDSVETMVFRDWKRDRASAEW